ncbi:MAG: nucleoside triphosphate pyrophosphohydrolase [Vicinamibacterales bacterium]
MPTRSRASRSRAGASREPKPRLAQTAAGAEFQKLVDIMARLRGANGCPWDREQTIQSLRGFLLEETYEALDAIDRGNHDALLGEIGDLLFEGVFLAQVETDDGHFTVTDCLRAICEKLIRRHPHIFGSAASHVRTAGQVVEQWEQIKAREQQDAGERRSLLRGVPSSLPSLLRAHEIGTRVAAVGFDWTRTLDVVGKIEEEVAELRRAISSEGAARSEEEMGDLLFSIANLSRKLGIEPESALRRANAKFSARFDALEQAFERERRSIHDATLEEMESQWAKIKHLSPDRLESMAAARGGHEPGHQLVHEPTAPSKGRRVEESKTKNVPADKSATRRRNQETKKTRKPVTRTAARAPAGARRRK